MNPDSQQLRETFQDALRRPKPAPAQQEPPKVGPLADRQPDRTSFLLSLARIRPDPDQVRKRNKSEEDEKVRDLAKSIADIGIQNPLIVRYLPLEDMYKLIAGERRYAAAKFLGLKQVPVKLKDADDKLARRLQLHENIHRADLTPLELSRALHAMLADGETPDSLATFLSKSPSFVHKSLAIGQNLSPSAQAFAEENADRFADLELLYDVAQTPPAEHEPILRRIASEGLNRASVRKITAPLKEIRETRPTKRGRKAGTRAYARRFPVSHRVIVTVTFPKATATDAEIRAALKEALASTQAD